MSSTSVTLNFDRLILRSHVFNRDLLFAQTSTWNLMKVCVCALCACMRACMCMCACAYLCVHV